jgi:hypothetical protein
MRIKLSDPTHVEELVDFLRQMGYVAQQEGEETVKAFLPFVPQESHARIDIALLLRSWQARGHGVAVIV